MSNQKQYRMKFNGLAGPIKKSDIVEVVDIKYGVCEVVKPGTDQRDYAMVDDLVLIVPQEVPQ